MHFKIKRSALVFPGGCGKTKANQIKTDTQWMKEMGPDMMSKKMTAVLAFQRDDKVNFK